MPLNERDLSLLIDMMECILDIREFTSAVSYNDFENDKMRRLAVERQLEIIGQAAGKISPEAQSLYSSIPWAPIISLRNRLAHDYGEILTKRIWDISRVSVEQLYHELVKVEELGKYIKS